jgi:hypothetical protein
MAKVLEAIGDWLFLVMDIQINVQYYFQLGVTSLLILWRVVEAQTMMTVFCNECGYETRMYLLYNIEYFYQYIHTFMCNKGGSVFFGRMATSMHFLNDHISLPASFNLLF